MSRFKLVLAVAMAAICFSIAVPASSRAETIQLTPKECAVVSIGVSDVLEEQVSRLEIDQDLLRIVKIIVSKIPVGTDSIFERVFVWCMSVEGIIELPDEI